MCNRFRSTRSERYLAERFQAWNEIGHQPRFNVAPTQPVLTVRKEAGVRRMSLMRWGLVPSWASGMSAGNFNARSETVTTTPSFRDPIHSKRCLIPADGFYEWQKMGAISQPYCFEVGEGDLFAFAGLWDAWKDPAGQTIETCTILTTTANSLIADLHDRMPVILPPAKYDLWLNTDPQNLDGALAALNPYDPNVMRRYPVSTKLNNAQNDGPDSARRIEIEVPSQQQLF